MWLTGYDSPPLHTLYVDKPMRGAALMQALARVNRTFRDKQDGLLVGYAPLEGNLLEAIAEYTDRDQLTKPLGHDMAEALAKVRELHDIVGNVILGRLRLARRVGREVAAGISGRDPWDAGVPAQPADSGQRRRRGRADARRQVPQGSGPARPVLRACAPPALTCGTTEMTSRSSRRCGSTWPSSTRRSAESEGCRCLRRWSSTCGSSPLGRSRRAASPMSTKRPGVGRPDLSQLDEAFIAKMQRNRHPNLVIEALRRLIEEQKRKVTRHNIVRQKSFSDRLLELMNRYTNQQLTSAEIIAELVALARDLAADADRGAQFSPALTPR